MMNSEWLSEILETLFIVATAVTAKKVIALKGFSALGLPVGAMPIDAIPIYVERVMFAFPVFIAALARAILTAAFSFEPGAKTIKGFATVQAGTLYFSFALSRFDSCILAFWGAVLSTSVFFAGWMALKLLTAKSTGICLSFTPCFMEASF
jgi:hypothetical protein